MLRDIAQSIMQFLRNRKSSNFYKNKKDLNPYFTMIKRYLNVF